MADSQSGVPDLPKPELLSLKAFLGTTLMRSAPLKVHAQCRALTPAVKGGKRRVPAGEEMTAWEHVYR